MTVNDCIKEIRKAENALDVLNMYKKGNIQNIVKTGIEEIESLICNYIDLLSDKEVKE